MAKRTELRVGIFVLIGLSMVGVVIFLIGETSRMFETKATYYASFTDVEGLAPGSSVRMGGVPIGRVARVYYSENPDSDEITLELSIVSSEAVRIREDSVAIIEPKGMLGDKLLSISVGDPTRPPLEEGSPIPPGKGDSILARLSQIGEQAGEVVNNLEKTTSTLAEDAFRQDIRETASGARKLFQSMEDGEGYVPRLLHDPEEAERLSRSIENLERASARLDRVLGGVERVVHQVTEGPGTAHDLLYGSDGTQAVVKIGNAADQVAVALADIKAGNGLARQLLYGGSGTDSSERVLADLAAITSDLRTMTRGVREGKGTLGALLVDPSVYEDLKVLLGNVQRNAALRSLVRYSIKQDEATPQVSNPDPAPQAAAAP